MIGSVSLFRSGVKPVPDLENYSSLDRISEIFNIIRIRGISIFIIDGRQ